MEPHPNSSKPFLTSDVMTKTVESATDLPERPRLIVGGDEGRYDAERADYHISQRQPVDKLTAVYIYGELSHKHFDLLAEFYDEGQFAAS